MRLEAREHRERTGGLEMFSTWTENSTSSSSKFQSFDLLLLLLLLLQVSKGEEVASAALPEENVDVQEKI